VNLAGFDASRMRTLFVRYERIGDMIMATGLIRVLANASSRGKVDVVANSATRPVLEHNPHVGKIFILDRHSRISYLSLMMQLRREHYDVIVDGRINNPPIFTSTPMLMLAARAPYRIGVTGGNNDLIYNVRVPAYDRSVPYIEGSKALSMPYGVDPTAVDWRPEIFLTDAERSAAENPWKKAWLAARIPGDRTHNKRLLVNVSASEPKRRWDDDRFVAVLRQVRAIAPTIPIAVIGLPSEWERVLSVARAVKAHAAETPRLRDALALVGTSDMVFTPDTSISHAASAFRKPAVVLLKRDHHPYAPYQIPGENILWDGNEITSLPVETVSAAVERLVRAYG
jgi:ADP-heptose:LPS heptosyltransferase